MSIRVIILCEDLQLATFIRRFLKRQGWHYRALYTRIAPPGQGSGEQWVREQYPRELEAIRKKPGTVLVVGTDADMMSVKDRIASLHEECRKHDVTDRGTHEPVVMVVPKRNIETWFAYLRGNAVNETDTYPRYPQESHCKEDVDALMKMCRNQKLRSPAPPSLEVTCKEFLRMPSPKK